MGQISTWAEIRAAPVAGQQGGPRGEAAAGAEPGGDDPVRVDAQLVGVLGRPQQAVVAVLDRVGVGGLGCQPVVHGDHDGTEQVEPFRGMSIWAKRSPIIMPPPCIQ